MHDDARVLGDDGRRQGTDSGDSPAFADALVLLDEQVLPVVEAGCERLRITLAALARGAEGQTDAVVAATAALGELQGAEQRIRRLLEAALDAEPDPDLVRRLMGCGRRLRSRMGLSFDLHDSRTRETPRSLEHTLLRIGLEALEDTARHAGVTHVRVRLADRLAGVELTVADDGAAPTGAPERSGGRIMDRRALADGGWVRVEPGLVGGTIVTCWLPVPDDHPSGLDQGHPAAS